VYDVRGKLVRVLARGPMEAGAHSAVWDGLNERGDPVASGVYFYRLQAGSFTETKKLVLLR
jgi:flagellar hook assembly protein FlgD